MLIRLPMLRSSLSLRSSNHPQWLFPKTPTYLYFLVPTWKSQYIVIILVRIHFTAGEMEAIGGKLYRVYIYIYINIYFTQVQLLLLKYNIILFTPLFSTPRQGSISNPCKPLIALPRSRIAPCSIGRRGCLGRRSLGTMDVTVLRRHCKKLLVSSTNHPKYGWETWEKKPSIFEPPTKRMLTWLGHSLHLRCQWPLDVPSDFVSTFIAHCHLETARGCYSSRIDMTHRILVVIRLPKVRDRFRAFSI